MRIAGILLFALLAAVAFAVPLYHHDQTLGHDWGYFNSLSWVVKTSIGHYGEWNVQDPWGCGGLDVWANPQQRIVSPFLAFDLTLPPHLANLAALLVHAFFGLIGAFYFFRHLGIAAPIAVACAFLFINSSWLALHYAAGHVPFGGMQLVPWAAVCAFHLKRPAAQLGLVGLMILLLWDGGMYAAIFSAYLVLTIWLTGLGGARWSDLKALTAAPLRTALLGLAAAGALLAKVAPMVANGGKANAQRESAQVLPPLFLRMFFDPRQWSPPDEFVFPKLRFHEFGCYVGVPLTALIIWYFWRDETRRTRHKRLLVAMMIWFWAAMAWGGDFNPWHVHRMLPFVNIAHVQSRATLVLFLFILLLAGYALTEVRLRSRWVWAIVALLVSESIAVRTVAYEWTYRWYQGPALPNAPISKQTITRTERTAEKPDQYQSDGLAVVNCYEPSLPWGGRQARSVDMAEYHGEIWVGGHDYGPPTGPAPRTGTAQLQSYVPGTLRFTYALSAPPPQYITLNTRHNGGWQAPPGVEIVSNPQTLLTLRVNATEGDLTLRYRPAYRPWQLAGFGLTALAFFGAACFVRGDAKKRARQESPSLVVPASAG